MRGRRFPTSWPRGAALFAALLLAPNAFGWTHVARGGETLEQLALRYYGRAEMATVIRAANGFVHPDDGSVTPGERIEIPEASLHRVQPGESWASIADQYLGSSKRGSFLARMNGSGADRPPPRGGVIRLPYHVRHILAIGDSLKKVAHLYYGNKRSPQWLRQYNLTRQNRYRRGDVLIVPLIDLEITAAERARIDGIRDGGAAAKELETQQAAGADLLGIARLVEQGRYIQVVAEAGRLLGRGMLSEPQQITVNQQLGFAYVALGEDQLAREAFLRAIALQPEAELPALTTSPKILKLYHASKEAFLKDRKEKEQRAAAQAPDASAPPPPKAPGKP